MNKQQTIRMPSRQYFTPLTLHHHTISLSHFPFACIIFHLFLCFPLSIFLFVPPSRSIVHSFVQSRRSSLFMIFMCIHMYIFNHIINIFSSCRFNLISISIKLLFVNTCQSCMNEQPSIATCLMITLPITSTLQHRE